MLPPLFEFTSQQIPQKVRKLIIWILWRCSGRTHDSLMNNIIHSVSSVSSPFSIYSNKPALTLSGSLLLFSYKYTLLIITDYIFYYNNKRIKAKLKGLSPVQYRIKSFQ